MKRNLKYWLIGNIIAIWIGIYILILHSLILHSFFYEILDYYKFSIIIKLILFISPFLAGLTVKLIKKDIPFYYYGTVGIMFLILFLLLICISDYKIHLSDYFFTTILYERLIQTIIYSISGGIIALLLNNFLAHRKKIFSFIR